MRVLCFAASEEVGKSKKEGEVWRVHYEGGKSLFTRIPKVTSILFPRYGSISKTPAAHFKFNSQTARNGLGLDGLATRPTLIRCTRFPLGQLIAM
jgi:hypothetical protein